MKHVKKYALSLALFFFLAFSGALVSCGGQGTTETEEGTETEQPAETEEATEEAGDEHPAEGDSEHPTEGGEEHPHEEDTTKME